MGFPYFEMGFSNRFFILKCNLPHNFRAIFQEMLLGFTDAMKQKKPVDTEGNILHKGKNLHFASF